MEAKVPSIKVTAQVFDGKLVVNGDPATIQLLVENPDMLDELRMEALERAKAEELASESAKVQPPCEPRPLLTPIDRAVAALARFNGTGFAHLAAGEQLEHELRALGKVLQQPSVQGEEVGHG